MKTSTLVNMLQETIKGVGDVDVVVRDMSSKKNYDIYALGRYPNTNKTHIEIHSK